MASSRINVKQIAWYPADPTTLLEGELAALVINRKSTFFRACSTFVTVGGLVSTTPKRVTVSYAALARIAASGSTFATAAQHTTQGETAFDLLVPGLLWSPVDIEAALNTLTDLGLFDSTFESVEHAMGGAMELEKPSPLPHNLLSYKSNWQVMPRGAYVTADWGGNVPQLAGLTVAQLIAAGATPDVVVHLTLILGSQWNDTLWAAAAAPGSSHHEAIEMLVQLFYRSTITPGVKKVVLADPFFCARFSSFWVLLHGTDHRLRVHMTSFDRMYLSHLYNLVYTTGSTRADALASFTRDHVLSLVWPYKSISSICVNETNSPLAHSALSSFISLYTPAASEVTRNSLQVLEAHLVKRSGAVQAAFKTKPTLQGVLTSLIALSAADTSVVADGDKGPSLDSAVGRDSAELSAPPLKGEGRTLVLNHATFLSGSAKLAKEMDKPVRDPVLICAKVFLGRSALLLQVGYNVSGRAGLSVLTTAVCSYLHPLPVGSTIAGYSKMDRTNLAYYLASVANLDSAGNYTTDTRLQASSAPQDFVTAVCTMQLDSPPFCFAYLRLHFKAIKFQTRAVFSPFEDYYTDMKVMSEVQADGQKITKAMGWAEFPASGLNWSNFIGCLITAVEGLDILVDPTMRQTRKSLIISAYHEGLRHASAAAISFLRGIPGEKDEDMGAFISDPNLPALRQLEADRLESEQQRLTMLAMTPMGDRLPVSSLDHVNRAEGGGKKAKLDGGMVALAQPSPLSEEQAALLGSKANQIHFSTSKKCFWYGSSNDMFSLAIIKKLAPGLCPFFGMSRSAGDAALAFCRDKHLSPPGQGPHCLPVDIDTVRREARSVFTPRLAAPKAAAAEAEPEDGGTDPPLPAAAPEHRKKGAGKPGGKGGKGKDPFRRR